MNRNPILPLPHWPGLLNFHPRHWLPSPSHLGDYASYIDVSARLGKPSGRFCKVGEHPGSWSRFYFTPSKIPSFSQYCYYQVLCIRTIYIAPPAPRSNVASILPCIERKTATLATFPKRKAQWLYCSSNLHPSARSHCQVVQLACFES